MVTMPWWIKRSGPEQAAAEPRSMLNVSKSQSILFGYSDALVTFVVSKLYMLMMCAVLRVVSNCKFDAGTSLERWWAEVVQDVPKSTEI